MIMTIGRFSNLSAIPITTLRFWEKSGIFAPAYINPESGYRYYDTDQLEQVHIITALQNCGLSNAEIKRCIAPGTNTEIYAARLTELQRAKRRLEAAIRHLDFYLEDAAGQSAIVLKSIPEMWYLSSKKRFSDIHEQHLEFARIVDYVIRNRVSSRQPFQTVGIYCNGEMETTNFEYECLVRAKSPPPGCPYDFKALPAIETAVTVIYKGDYEIPYRYYSMLMSWIESNGYTVCGPVREWFVTDPYDGKTEEGRHISEMQIPISLKAD